MALQLLQNWELDPLSLLIGLGAGLLLFQIVRWSWPRLIPWLRESVDNILNAIRFRGFDLDSATRDDIQERVRRRHFLGARTDLDQIMIARRLLLPNSQANHANSVNAGAIQIHTLWPKLANRSAVPQPPSCSLRQMLLEGMRVVLIGEDGDGKTTLLDYCELMWATADDDNYSFLNSRLPIRVDAVEFHLRHSLNDTPDENDETAIRPITDILRLRNNKFHIRTLDQIIEEKAEKGELLLLVDGFDELPDTGQRDLVDWLRRFTNRFGQNQIIVTSSLIGFAPLLQMGFVSTRLLPWRIGDAKAFGKRWIKAVQQSQLPSVESYWQPWYLPWETALRLMSSYNKRSLDDNRSLTRQVDLLEYNLVQILSEIGDDADPWLRTAARELWQEIAYSLVRGDQPFVAQSELMTLIHSAIEDIKVEFNPETENLLVQTILDCGLFTYTARQAVWMRSPIWRDFLASCHLLQAGLSPTNGSSPNDPKWQGVVDFYIGREGADELAPRLLSSDQGLMEASLFRLANWLAQSPAGGVWRRQVLVGLGRMIVDAKLPTALRQRAALAMAQTGEEGVPVLLRQLLREVSGAMRQTGLAAIARAQSLESIDVITRMQGDSDMQVRWTAVHALGWINSPGAERALMLAFLEEDSVVSQAAAEGLALNGTSNAIALLREAIEDQDLNVRRAAVYGLALIDQEWSREILKKTAREDAQWSIQAAAERALEQTSPTAESKLWLPVLAGDQAWLVEWAFEEGRGVPVGPGAVSLMIEALEDEDPQIRASAASSLGMLLERQATGFLRARLADSDNDVRDQAFAALTSIGDAWNEPDFEGRTMNPMRAAAISQPQITI